MSDPSPTSSNPSQKQATKTINLYAGNHEPVRSSVGHHYHGYSTYTDPKTHNVRSTTGHSNYTYGTPTTRTVHGKGTHLTATTGRSEYRTPSNPLVSRTYHGERETHGQTLREPQYSNPLLTRHSGFTRHGDVNVHQSTNFGHSYVRSSHPTGYSTHTSGTPGVRRVVKSGTHSEETPVGGSVKVSGTVKRTGSSTTTRVQYRMSEEEKKKMEDLEEQVKKLEETKQNLKEKCEKNEEKVKELEEKLEKSKEKFEELEAKMGPEPITDMTREFEEFKAGADKQKQEDRETIEEFTKKVTEMTLELEVQKARMGN